MRGNTKIKTNIFDEAGFEPGIRLRDQRLINTGTGKLKIILNSSTNVLSVGCFDTKSSSVASILVFNQFESRIVEAAYLIGFNFLKKPPNITLQQSHGQQIEGQDSNIPILGKTQ